MSPVQMATDCYVTYQCIDNTRFHWRNASHRMSQLILKAAHFIFSALQGARAQAFVGTWDWRKVADQYATLIRGEDPIPLSPDPFADAPAVVASAYWNGSSIGLPNRKSWDSLFLTPLPRLSMGAYALYIDVDIQVCPSDSPSDKVW